MAKRVSNLEKARRLYQPKLPKALQSGKIGIQFGAATEPPADKDEIRSLFPNTYGQPVVRIVEGEGDLSQSALKVGVVLSGGQAPGGHNVIAGIFDALKSANKESRLLGFRKGPRGVIKGDYVEITAEMVDEYRNTGGFDMIMSGRDKIETDEDLSSCRNCLSHLELDGLVIIGGDDSNTNAAVLAEYLKANGESRCIIGVPKTIDGDMKGELIETSFGFDTACKVYSELIGNICRDATSAVKYWHFIRLMGRAASHVALECALQTQPNITLISEEIKAENTTLAGIVDYITDIVLERANAGKNYGILLVPEGLIEFIGDIRRMIDELSAILGKEEKYIQGLSDHSERVQYLNTQLSPESAKVYGSLPVDIQESLLKRDQFGHIPLSQIETERLLVDLVSDKIRFLKKHDPELDKKVKFSPLTHFFGYEGRCAAPSNFDADYAYSLGYAAVQLIRAGLTGYTVSIQNLIKPCDEWIAGGVPITMMLNLESRKGRRIPVIRRALVDLNGPAFKLFAENREAWAINDDYVYPGPIQYFGPPEACETRPMSLVLEKGSTV